MSDSSYPSPELVGKGIIIIGIVLIIIGIFLLYGQKIPFLGKLPGDIHIQKDNFSFYFPVTTCIIISILLYFILKLFKQ